MKCVKQRECTINKAPVGSVFSRLTVERIEGEYLVCSCSCGTAEKLILRKSVISGNTKSCGCLRPEKRAEVGRNSATHGKTKTVEYTLWNSARQRCYNERNKSYSRYGGRGICMSEDWQSFERFLLDMGLRPSPTHSLDRIDNNGPYSKENCRWATPVQQNRNRSTTIYVELDGVKTPMIELCARFGVTYDTAYRQLRRNGKPATSVFPIRPEADPVTTDCDVGVEA